MKKRLFIVAAALSLFMSSCTTSESSYINNNDLVTISVEESQNYTVNSENPLNVVRGEDAIFKITFNGDYNYKSSSNGTYDTANGNFTVSNVQFSQTIYIESVEMVTVTIVDEESHFTINSQNPLKIEKDWMLTLTLNLKKDTHLSHQQLGNMKTEDLLYEMFKIVLAHLYIQE